jgi:adenylate cyclase 10
MRRELPKIQCECSVGIVTGTVFAGVVGTSGSRREYSVLGDSVNLAARLMQAACGENEYKILVCAETAKSAENCISFRYLKSQVVKGKN